MSDSIAFLHNATEIIRERLKSSLLGMLSDEQLDKLIKKEWDEFFVPTTQETFDNYGRVVSSTESSEIERMISSEIHKQIGVRLKESVKELCWKVTQNSDPASDAVVALIDRCGKSLLAQSIEIFVQACVQNMRNNGMLER